jgi:hypothetical protein
MIATDERCGGTTLAVTVQKLIGRRLVHDPFHPRKRRDYPASTEREIAHSVHKIRTELGGAKCSWKLHPLATYLQILDEFQRQGFKIVFLWRRNALQRQLSLALARLTGIWDLYHEENAKGYRAVSVPVLDVGRLAEHIERYHEKLEGVASHLRQRYIDHFAIEFQSVYGPDVTFEARLQVIARLAGFLGVDPGRVHEMSARFRHLTPDKRLNGVESYRRVPNIEEIERALSNGRNGLLWDQAGDGRTGEERAAGSGLR